MQHRPAGMLLCLSLLVAYPATAQVGRWMIGGGLLLPAGEYSLHDKAGWQAFAAFAPFGSPARPFSVRIDGTYGRTSRKTSAPASMSQVFGLGASLALRPPGKHRVDPYALASVGFYEQEEGVAGGGASSPINGIALGGGAGVSVGLGGVRAFLEGRFIGGPVQHGVDFIPITLGVSLP
jgi:hypothetical protein